VTAPPEPAVPRCDYHERERHCPEPPTVEILIDGKQAKLCARHQRPEYHPDDIRRRLPGKLAQAVRRFTS
jgi:hypothetical protein